MQCLVVDLNKIDYNKSLTHNIWLQFGVDVEKLVEKLDVSKHYMPEKEQTIFYEYVKKNWKKFKYYTPNKKARVLKSFAWEYLDYFPTSVRKGDVDED